jgi:predicted DNA-binding transcriptional regulator YafY
VVHADEFDDESCHCYVGIGWEAMSRRLVGSARQAGYVQLHQATPLVERQHAIIEELRLNAPRATTAAQLAERTGVSTRTIERDIERLSSAGVPVQRRRGRYGGFRLDAVQRPAPLALSPGEIATLIASLSALGPYTTATGDSALRKLVAALTSGGAEASMVSDAETGSLPDGQDQAGSAEQQ